ncbi:MAG: sugar ABC transporter permease [Eubacteriales bacterium]|nr:sugar ABC transporter permease [Eubacteriales bacterium]
MKQKKKRDTLQPGAPKTAAYLAPGLLVYGMVFLLPVLLVIVMSFFKFSSIKKFTFVGLANYERLLSDANVWVALRNNLFLVAVCLVGQIGIAFLLACLLSSKRVKGAGIYRTVIYFPVTLSAVVIGYVWRFVYDYNYGLITYFMNAIGQGDKVTPLLSQVDTVMFCVCIPMIWQYVGFHLVIILSAMTSIDKEVLEVAELDGCSGVQKARYILFPLIRPTLVVCVFLCISANMKAFDHIMTLTNGGPGNASSVLALYAYNVSFQQFNMGYGSAISVFILLVTAVLFVVSRLPGFIGKRRERTHGE